MKNKDRRLWPENMRQIHPLSSHFSFPFLFCFFILHPCDWFFLSAFSVRLQMFLTWRWKINKKPDLHIESKIMLVISTIIIRCLCNIIVIHVMHGMCLYVFKYMWALVINVCMYICYLCMSENGIEPSAVKGGKRGHVKGHTPNI